PAPPTLHELLTCDFGDVAGRFRGLFSAFLGDHLWQPTVYRRSPSANTEPMATRSALDEAPMPGPTRFRPDRSGGLRGGWPRSSAPARAGVRRSGPPSGVRPGAWRACRLAGSEAWGRRAKPVIGVRPGAPSLVAKPVKGRRASVHQLVHLLRH